MQMTSKERVLTTFASQEADRAPVNYSANPGIDRRLKEHFGLEADDSEGLRRSLALTFAVLAPRTVGRNYTRMSVIERLTIGEFIAAGLNMRVVDIGIIVISHCVRRTKKLLPHGRCHHQRIVIAPELRKHASDTRSSL